MTGDVCDCGICEVETCDLCAAPVAFVDEDGEAWCRSCWESYQDDVNFAAFERELASWHGGDAWPYTTRWEEPR
jgi:hypothetical protein